MKFITIVKKKFRLASRLTRLYALFLDVIFLAISLPILYLLLQVGGWIAFAGLTFALWKLGPRNGFQRGTLIIAQLLLLLLTFLTIEVDGQSYSEILPGLAFMSWCLGLLFIDGFRNGQGIGKSYSPYKLSG